MASNGSQQPPAHEQPAGPMGLWAGYTQHGIHPLGGYALLVGTFLSLWAAFLTVVRFSGRSLPERVGLGDLLLLGVGTYRLSRLLTKDSVTSIFRAPFTRFEHPIGDGEVEEKPRGRGVAHALGELVVCPYCIGQWVVSFFTFGLILAPRFTRLVAGMLAAYTLSDYLQLTTDAFKRTVLHMPQGR